MKSMEINHMRYQILYVVYSYMLITLTEVLKRISIKMFYTYPFNFNF